jgi:type VI secretion system protein ImpG
MQALGLDTPPGIMAGMQMSLVRRTTLRTEDEPPDKQAALKPDIWLSKCRATDIPFHIVCNESDAARIYEQLFAHCRGIHLRYLNEFGDPAFVKLPDNALQQIGFDRAENLLPPTIACSEASTCCVNCSSCHRSFLDSTLASRISCRKSGQVVDIVSFDRSDQRLASAVRPTAFSLFSAPIINLFELTAARVPIKSNEHEYHVVADRGRSLDFEVHRILKVFAHFEGGSEKADVYPLYSAPPSGVVESKAIYYGLRRLPTAQR